MNTSHAGTRLLTALLVVASSGASAHTPRQDAVPGLGSTSWQLVRFQGGDDTTLTPDDRSKYTLQFGADGSLTARIDCNRGRGTWTSPGPNQLQLGPLALTRAMCPPGSLHEQIVKQWAYIRSYVVEDGHLFLSLMADGGTYELEPIAAATPKASGPSRVSSIGPVAYECTQTGGGADTLQATFYETRPALVLVEREGRTRPAFQVAAASGARYEGQDLTFWDKGGEASVTWSGNGLACRRR